MALMCFYLPPKEKDVEASTKCWRMEVNVTGGWENCVLNDELNTLYSSFDMIRVSELTRMKWEGHVARLLRETEIFCNVQIILTMIQYQ
jgi:hypothetical protein